MWRPSGRSCHVARVRGSRELVWSGPGRCRHTSDSGAAARLGDAHGLPQLPRRRTNPAARAQPRRRRASASAADRSRALRACAVDMTPSRVKSEQLLCGDFAASPPCGETPARRDVIGAPCGACGSCSRGLPTRDVPWSCGCPRSATVPHSGQQAPRTCANVQVRGHSLHLNTRSKPLMRFSVCGAFLRRSQPDTSG